MKGWLAFFEEARAEFRKISWPTKEEVQGSTAVVLVTVLFLTGLFAVYDAVITQVMRLVIP